MAQHFDLIVIGSGPAGRRAAVQAAKLKKSVLVVTGRPASSDTRRPRTGVSIAAPKGTTSMATPRYTRERTALLLVDPYKDFLSEGGKLWPYVRDVAQSVGLHDNLHALLGAVRKVEIRVFIVPHHRAEPGDFESWEHPNPDQLGGARGWRVRWGIDHFTMRASTGPSTAKNRT
jgi:choline dehydrogenase-like flavoprotein